MIGLSELYRGRTALDVPWDPARERRVLDGALASCRRRARRRRVLELCGAVLTIALLGRTLARSSSASRILVHSSASHEVEPALAVPAAELVPRPSNDPTIALPDDTAKRAKSAASGGFAGTGGHGGGGSTGFGGSAGTG